MPNIIIVMQDNCTDTVGGSIAITTDIANMLANNNYNVTTCALNATSDNRPQHLIDTIPFYNLANSFGNFNLFIDKIKPDLIIFVFPSLLVEAKLNEDNLKTIPKILMFHSRPDYYFTFQVSEYQLQKVYTNTIAQILLPSYYNLLPDFIKNSPVVYIPNYSTESDFKINTNKENKKIVYLSRIDNLKGHDILIKAFSKIAKKYSNWQIDIYGQSEPKNYVDTLKKLCKKLKVTNQVQFKGVTSEVTKTLSNYDFCVFPSLIEGFPVGLIEAQSVGLPAIGFKACSGVNELIIDNQNGFLVDYNVNDLAKKIEYLIQNRDKRALMSNNALKYCAKYDITHFNKMWLSTIENILSGKNPDSFSKIKSNYIPFSLSTFENKLDKANFTLMQKIFSIKNSKNIRYKIITILGLQIKIKKAL